MRAHRASLHGGGDRTNERTEHRRRVLGLLATDHRVLFASSTRGVSGCCAATDAGAYACFSGRIDCAVVAPTAAAAASSSADSAGMRSGSHLLLRITCTCGRATGVLL
ncbi:hypothetical protein C2845_PM14G07290 [Panicum miliaceum]|uniref:Uncharacterized protein n=1 Tax=Panicum miliaceum TaxID=4540 RepID=A0A3L6PQ35_PANMI|nr:hypothetical protein C2845_PM14G07290 [Panicum miliaceum]